MITSIVPQALPNCICAGTLPTLGRNGSHSEGSPTFSTTHLVGLSGRGRGLGGVKSLHSFVRVGCGLHTFFSIPSLPSWCSCLLSQTGATECCLGVLLECCQPQPALQAVREHLGGFLAGALDCDTASSFKPVLTEFEKYLIVHSF